MTYQNIISSLAHVCLKEIGEFGPESVAMAAKIKAEWNPRAKAFLDEMLTSAFDFNSGTIDPKKSKEICNKHEYEMTEGFISAVGDAVLDYSILAFEDSLVHSYQKYRSPKAEKYSVLERLSQVTGSTKANVGRTINRWFNTTQGRYFTRFILPYTERITLERAAEDRKPTLNIIGRRYKEFVEAGGYWESVTDYDSATAHVFAQIESFFALGFEGVRIEAQLDRNCCPVCQTMDGAEWPLFEARAQMFDMLMMNADEAATYFPWPRMSDIKGGATPHRLPPFHLRCRCYAHPITISADSNLIPKEIQDIRGRVAGLLGVSSTRISRYIEGCDSKAEKGRDGACVNRNLKELQQAQSSYEGSLLVAGLIGWGLLRYLDRNNPVDYVTNKSAFDVHVISKDSKFRRSESQSKKLSNFSSESSLNPWTVVLVEGEPMSYEVYLREGFDDFSIEDMQSLGWAYREEGSDIIDDDMLEEFHSMIGE